MKKFKCTEGDCKREYNDAAHLGIHRRAAHGIIGKKRQTQIAATAAATPEPAPPVSAEVVAMTTQPKRKYTRRKTGLENIPQTAITSAGANRSNQESHFASDGIPEATLALALGRFQGLCASIATEFDLPPRSFAQRFAALIYSATVR